MAAASRHTCLVRATLSAVPVFTLAGAVDRSPVGATVGKVAISALPAINTLACSLGTAAVARAHLGPAARLGAVLTGKSSTALANASDALSIAGAVLRAFQVSTSRASEVGRAHTTPIHTHAMSRAGAVGLAGLEGAVTSLEPRVTLAAGLGAVALVDRIRALVGTTLLNVDAACRALKSSSAHTSAVILTRAVIAAVGFANLFLAAHAREPFFARTRSVCASATSMAVFRVLARQLLTLVASEPDHAATSPVIASAVLTAGLRARLARAIGAAGISIALA